MKSVAGGMVSEGGEGGDFCGGCESLSLIIIVISSQQTYNPLYIYSPI